MACLFKQSAAAQVNEANALIGRACDAIEESYRFYSAGWDERATAEAITGLTPVVQMALRNHAGIEGGIWQSRNGPLAYAFPTYQGSGPKTDIPQAELPRIRAINQNVLAEGRALNARVETPTEVLLLAACPLPGPLSGITAWAMTRVHIFAGKSYGQLMTGLGILLATLALATIIVLRLIFVWSKRVAQIERALGNVHEGALLELALTGERELDRVIVALNHTGARLGEAQRRAQILAQDMAKSERLASIGQLAAGIAHEIRNPIAAMSLKTENALAGPRSVAPRRWLLFWNNCRASMGWCRNCWRSANRRIRSLRK